MIYKTNQTKRVRPRLLALFLMLALTVSAVPVAALGDSSGSAADASGQTGSAADAKSAQDAYSEPTFSSLRTADDMQLDPPSDPVWLEDALTDLKVSGGTSASNDDTSGISGPAGQTAPKVSGSALETPAVQADPAVSNRAFSAPSGQTSSISSGSAFSVATSPLSSGSAFFTLHDRIYSTATVSVDDQSELEAAIASANADTDIQLSNVYSHGGTMINVNSPYSIVIDGGTANLNGTALVFNQSGSGKITLKNMNFTGGSATALDLRGANSIYMVDKSTFTGIDATAVKIGVNVAATFENCIFDGNHGEPGAISPATSSKITVRSSSFLNNYNSNSGGGCIVLSNGAAGDEAVFTIENCYFYRNYSDSAISQFMQGGAIRGSSLSYSRLTIRNSFFKENERRDAFSGNCDGGAIAIRNVGGGDTFVEITGCVFEGNKTGDDGGAVLLEGGQTATRQNAYIANCTFVENECGGSNVNGEGGAIIFYGMLDSEITHCTFYKNTAKRFVTSTIGGGGVAIDTGTGAPLPNLPVLSNNIFVANTSEALPERSNIYINPNANAGLQKNNGNVGYDNGEYVGYNQGENASAHVTTSNVFANKDSSGNPIKETFGHPVGASGQTAFLFAYTPSPLTDEMYRNGSGPYYDPLIRNDVRGYPRDHYPNAGAVEIYWTRFDPGTALGGAWIAQNIPATAIESLLEPGVYYLVTKPPTDNYLVTFPRASITHADPVHNSFRGWVSNQPDNPSANPGQYIYTPVNPGVRVESTKQRYTASWLYNPPEYRVDFNLMYQISGVPQYATGQLVLTGGKALRPSPDPVRPDLVFAGWYREPAYKNLWDFSANTVNEDITLYAKWTSKPKPKVTVRFADWDGQLLKTQIIDIGGNASPPAAPTRQGHVFTGWSGKYLGVTEDTTVFAAYRLEGGGGNPGGGGGNPGGGSGGGNSNPSGTNPTTPDPLERAPEDPSNEPNPDDAPALQPNDSRPNEKAPEIGDARTRPADDNRAVLEQIKENNGVIINLGGLEVPMSGIGYKGVWALLNFILIIAGGILAIFTFLTVSRRKWDLNTAQGWRAMLSIVAAAVNLLLFLLTENMRLLMVVVDIWTFPSIMLCAACGTCFVWSCFVQKQSNDESEKMNRIR
jgi:uncharacterized repeat protein (TIGR02543 family)